MKALDCTSIALHFTIWQTICLQMTPMLSGAVDTVTAKDDLCHLPCYGQTNSNCTYSQGTCPDGLFLDVNLTKSTDAPILTNDVKSNEEGVVIDAPVSVIDARCRLCSDVIANCCLCAYQNTTSEVSCVTCYVGFKPNSGGDACVIPLTSSLPTWAVCILVLVVLAALAGTIVGTVHLLRRFEILGKTENEPPRLPSISELSPASSLTKDRRKRKTGNVVNDKRYTPQPQLSVRQTNTSLRRDHIESVNYEQIDVDPTADAIAETSLLDTEYETPDANRLLAAPQSKLPSHSKSSAQSPRVDEMQEIYEIPEVYETAALKPSSNASTPNKAATSKNPNGPQPLIKGVKPKPAVKPAPPSKNKPTVGVGHGEKSPAVGEEIYENQTISPAPAQLLAPSSKLAYPPNLKKSQPRRSKIRPTEQSKQTCVEQAKTGGTVGGQVAAVSKADDVVYENTAVGPVQTSRGVDPEVQVYHNEPACDDDIYENNND